MARRRRALIDLRPLDLGKVRSATDLTFYERELVEHGVIPKSYLLKKAPRRGLDSALAALIAQDMIKIVTREDGDEIIVPLLSTKPPAPMRKGRFVKAVHPSAYNPGETRPNVNVPLLRRDRNLLWFIGDGRLGEGAQIVLHFVRKNLKRFKEQHPNITLPENFDE